MGLTQHEFISECPYYSFDGYITLGIAVIDGPMVGIEVHEDDNHLIQTPWVRVFVSSVNQRKEIL